MWTRLRKKDNKQNISHRFFHWILLYLDTPDGHTGLFQILFLTLDRPLHHKPGILFFYPHHTLQYTLCKRTIPKLQLKNECRKWMSTSASVIVRREASIGVHLMYCRQNAVEWYVAQATAGLIVCSVVVYSVIVGVRLVGCFLYLLWFVSVRICVQFSVLSIFHLDLYLHQKSRAFPNSSCH